MRRSLVPLSAIALLVVAVPARAGFIPSSPPRPQAEPAPGTPLDGQPHLVIIRENPNSEFVRVPLNFAVEGGKARIFDASGKVSDLLIFLKNSHGQYFVDVYSDHDKPGSKETDNGIEFYRAGSGVYEVIDTPEPSTLALCGAGLLTAAGLRWIRRRRRS